MLLALQARRDHWLATRIEMIKAARMAFSNVMLEQTGAVAKLRFSIEREELKILVSSFSFPAVAHRVWQADPLSSNFIPQVDFGRDGLKKSKNIELAQRSGGERSMTQLYYMIALWGGVESASLVELARGRLGTRSLTIFPFASRFVPLTSLMSFLMMRTKVRHRWLQTCPPAWSAKS
jgi:hypothetical protein